jgi:hypothetical protein
MRRAVWLLVAAFLAAVMLYLSQFWFLSLWSGPGLFGLRALPPGGDLVARWLRGTQAGPYDLLVWAIGCFALLTLVQKIHDWRTRDRNTDH